MSTFIHHHTAHPYTGGEEDGFDVIETDEISIWHRGLQQAWGFDSVQEAIDEAESLAQGFDDERDPTGAEWMRQLFEYEYCAECGRDHRHHTAIRDPLGNWFARCDLEPVEGPDGAPIPNPEGYDD